MGFLRNLLKRTRQEDEACAAAEARAAAEATAAEDHAAVEGRAKAEADDTSTPSPRLIYQEETDPPIHIDPDAITHAFVVLSHEDIQYAKAAAAKIADFNRHCQSKLWSIPFKATFIAFCADKTKSGLPDAQAIGPLLRQQGLSPASSIVVNTMQASFDGGSTYSRMLVGFAFKDREPKFIIAGYDGGCLPTDHG
jgi:hypothetical protein